jgi:hypothetical protein
MIGDHIRALKGGRWEHAIDCGDLTVIHLEEDRAPGARIRRSYRPEFVAGAEAVEVVTHRERVFPGKAVVSRAYSRVAERAVAATFRDSAQFAVWCKTGRVLDAQGAAVEVPGLAPAPSQAAPRAKPAPAPRKAKAPAKAAKPAARKAAPPRKAAPKKGASKPAARKAAPAKGAKKAAGKKATVKRLTPRKAAKRSAPRSAARGGGARKAAGAKRR